jgi:hypothetical protein
VRLKGVVAVMLARRRHVAKEPAAPRSVSCEEGYPGESHAERRLEIGDRRETHR